jgi:hypothetical protein
LVNVAALVVCGQLVLKLASAAEETAPSSLGTPGSGAKETVSGDETVIWFDEHGNIEVREITWDELIPEDCRSETLLKGNGAGDLSDDDQRAGRFCRVPYRLARAPRVRLRSPTLRGAAAVGAATG